VLPASSPHVPGNATPVAQKRLGRLSYTLLVLLNSGTGGTQMSSSPFVVARGQQLAGFLLATVPLAERMLLYQVAMTAWLMLPVRLAGKDFSRP
jgi:hypothetical protein